MRIRVKMWLEHEGRVLFGHGRLELLLALERGGSLAKAAAELGMSYRAAWGRINASERRLGFALVDHGPRGRRGARLTPEGRSLLEWFAILEKDLAGFLDQAVQRRPDCLERLDHPGLPNSRQG